MTIGKTLFGLKSCSYKYIEFSIQRKLRSISNLILDQNNCTVQSFNMSTDLTCEYCKQTKLFKNQAELNRHYNYKHIDKISIIWDHFCLLCRTLHPGIEELETHRAEAHFCEVTSFFRKLTRLTPCSHI